MAIISCATWTLVRSSHARKPMATDYDRFSRQFKKSREFPFRTCIEEFKMLQILGNLAGLTALILPVGRGITRDASSPRGGASHRGRHLGRYDCAGEGRGSGRAAWGRVCEGRRRGPRCCRGVRRGQCGLLRPRKHWSRARLCRNCSPCSPTPRRSTSSLPTTTRRSSSASDTACSPAVSSPGSSRTTKPSCRATTTSSSSCAVPIWLPSHPARRTVRRRALRRHQDAARAERDEDLLVPQPKPASRKTPSKRRTPSMPSWWASTPSYLIEFLKAIGNEGEVRLEFKDAQSAGQIRPEEGSDEVQSTATSSCPCGSEAVPAHPPSLPHLAAYARQDASA